LSSRLSRHFGGASGGKGISAPAFSDLRSPRRPRLILPKVLSVPIRVIPRLIWHFLRDESKYTAPNPIPSANAANAPAVAGITTIPVK